MHNTKQLGCGRTLEKFGEIITRLTAQVDRFTSMLDRVDVGFLPEVPSTGCPHPRRSAPPGSTGSTSTYPGSAPPSPPWRWRLPRQASPSPSFTAQVQAMTGQTQDGYTTCQGAYDLRKLRAKQLVAKPQRTRTTAPPV